MFNLVLLQKYFRLHTTTQHKRIKPIPSLTVCLANRERAKLFVEYSSIQRKKERVVNAESATGRQDCRRDGQEETPNE